MIAWKIIYLNRNCRERCKDMNGHRGFVRNCSSEVKARFFFRLNIFARVLPTLPNNVYWSGKKSSTEVELIWITTMSRLIPGAQIGFCMLKKRALYVNVITLQLKRNGRLQEVFLCFYHLLWSEIKHKYWLWETYLKTIWILDPRPSLSGPSHWACAKEHSSRVQGARWKSNHQGNYVLWVAYTYIHCFLDAL